MDDSIYIVNATATKYGGALTILKGYLSELEKTDGNSRYIVFCGADLDEFASGNIKFIRINTSGFGIGGVKRFLWELFGLFLFCKISGTRPDLIISFQNTGVFYPKVKQLIYYHQPIPLFKHNWKFYRSDEAVLFYYKKIYPIYIRLFINRNTEFVVQQKFIKELFARKFQISKNRIHTIVPHVNFKFDTQINKIELDTSRFHIFYPTNNAKYKNYNIIFEAISKIRIKSPELFAKVILHITLDESNKAINRTIENLRIIANINLLGKISYGEVVSYYNSVNLLVFPSYIETLGLPLLEAAYFGLPVLTADLDYAHEALDNYSGVNFVQFDSVEEWANKIIESSKASQRVKPFRRDSSYNSWSKLIELTNILVNGNS